MRYCKKCVMPDTRPGIIFNKEGICFPCVVAEKRKTIDWDKRLNELEILCNKYKKKNGDYYDCIIAVSGGKDSHFQVYIMKKIMKMNPLLLSVDNFSWTKTGRDNFTNIRDVFDCDCISLNLSPNTGRKLFKKAFIDFGSPTWFWDRAIYVYSMRMAIDMRIPLVVFGENISYEYGGIQTEETYSALEQVNTAGVRNIDLKKWIEDSNITMKSLNFCVYPSEYEIKQANINSIYLSYFVYWDGYDHCEFAKKYGFKSLNDTGEWEREGYIEDYDQIDAIGYLINPWLKYPKFGHARVTDVASNWIRKGRITREEGIKLVKEHDHKLDERIVEDFIDFIGITIKEFWQIVEKFYNRNIFEKADGQWKLKDPIYKKLLKREV